jgi:hypothetical protein
MLVWDYLLTGVQYFQHFYGHLHTGNPANETKLVSGDNGINLGHCFLQAVLYMAFLCFVLRTTTTLHCWALVMSYLPDMCLQLLVAWLNWRPSKHFSVSQYFVPKIFILDSFMS